MFSPGGGAKSAIYTSNFQTPHACPGGTGTHLPTWRKSKKLSRLSPEHAWNVPSGDLTSHVHAAHAIGETRPRLGQAAALRQQHMPVEKIAGQVQAGDDI